MAAEGNIKHLDYLQAAIGRMAGAAFTAKGWSITVCTALLGLVIKDSATSLLSIAWLPVLIFWWLDAYFLVLERRFRGLFDMAVREWQAQRPATFQMSPGPVSPLSVIAAMASPTLLPIHGVLALALISVWLSR